jgi:hypothetical protein
MPVRFVGVDLAKPSQSIANAFSKHHPVRLGVLLERDLGPGTKADCDSRIVRARKAPVPVENSVDTKVSATSAGRVVTACKL